MTAKNISGAAVPAWVSTVVILTAAAVGIAAAASVHALGGIVLTTAMASQASGYCETFLPPRTVSEAFSCAVALSRTDIAWMFVAQLFPLLAVIPSRVLTVTCAALRMFLSAMAIVAAATAPAAFPASIAAVLSLAAGAVAVTFTLHDAFVLGGCEVSLRGSVRGVALACAWSGGIILCRLAILITAGS